MLESISLSEIVLFIVGTLFSVVGFFLRDLHSRLSRVEAGLQEHRVDTAQNLVNRSEIKILRDDIRGMLAPINVKIDSIENFLRDSSKSHH